MQNADISARLPAQGDSNSANHRSQLRSLAAPRRTAVPTAHEPVKSAAPYLTPEQVAELLAVSPKTVYRWAATDASMPATRVGKAVRFRADLLDRWLAARTQQSRRLIADQSDESGATGTSTVA